MSKLVYDPGCYLAFVLSKEARGDLIKFFPPTFERVICHHVTLAFKMDESLFDAIIDVVGDSPKVVATSYMVGQNLDCFTIEVNGARRLTINDQHYHVTHSLRPPAKPVDSNKLIRSGGDARQINFDLTGKLELVPR